MAKTKAIPTLPGSSRMQMPSTSISASSVASGKGAMKGKAISDVKSGGVATKLVGHLKGKKGMKGMNPYC
jgi:hypothetical protein